MPRIKMSTSQQRAQASTPARVEIRPLYANGSREHSAQFHARPDSSLCPVKAFQFESRDESSSWSSGVCTFGRSDNVNKLWHWSKNSNVCESRRSKDVHQSRKSCGVCN